eukprot:TRINITY_DN376_c0_g1_i1.p1 TRINITY_DN376_c0_g1~~TRINITY_DN376_c0_g1_i1.p1  ORF type:complete len:221 (-),score=46.92 TRINITY_DN376_c0_g1_i1:23-685(-)
MTQVAKKEEKSLKQAAKDAIINMVSGADLDTLKQLAFKESSSTMGPRQDGRGFSKFEMASNKSEGVMIATNLPILLEMWRNDPPICFKMMPPHIRDQMHYELKIALLQESFVAQVFEIQFVAGQGQLHVVHLSFETRSDGKVRWVLAHVRGAFELAPDYMVISHSKKNFFGSKQWDEIVYIPRGITDADVLAIIKTAFIPAMAFLQEKLGGSTPVGLLEQ